MFWADIARFLKYFRNFSNSFINIFTISQDFNGIFLKYSLNITVLCGFQSFFIRIMDLKKKCQDVNLCKKVSALKKNTIFPIAMQESTQSRKLTSILYFFWKAETLLHKACNLTLEEGEVQTRVNNWRNHPYIV